MKLTLKKKKNQDFTELISCWIFRGHYHSHIRHRCTRLLGGWERGTTRQKSHRSVSVGVSMHYQPSRSRDLLFSLSLRVLNQQRSTQNSFQPKIWWNFVKFKINSLFFSSYQFNKNKCTIYLWNSIWYLMHRKNRTLTKYNFFFWTNRMERTVHQK